MIYLNNFFTPLNGALDMAYGHQFELPSCRWTLLPVYCKVSAILAFCVVYTMPLCGYSILCLYSHLVRDFWVLSTL